MRTVPAKKLTLNGTLLPLGLVVVILAGVWGLSADRSKAIVQIEANQQFIVANRLALDQFRLELEYVRRALMRIEIKLGTLPAQVEDNWPHLPTPASGPDPP